MAFCEGGPPQNVIEALRQSDSTLTLDTLFWCTAVSQAGVTKSLHFKSVGSKSTLKGIHSDVIRLKIDHVTVCLDSDYDRLLGNALDAPRLAYTAGYSWESDVLDPLAIREVFTDLCGIGSRQSEILEELFIGLGQIGLDLKTWCEIDIALRRLKKPSVFSRDKPLQCADVSSAKLKIKHELLSSCLTSQGYRRRPRQVVSVGARDVFSIGFGKLMSRLFYHILSHALVKFDAKLKLKYDLVMRLLIAKTFALVRSGQLPQLRQHYEAQATCF